MVFGGIEQDRVQINEDTLRAGGPYDPNNPEARAAWPVVRRRIAAGNYAAAQQLVLEKCMSKPLRQMPYQTVGDLFANCARAAELLGRDPDFRKQVTAARARLAPLQIGQAGQPGRLATAASRATCG